MDINDEITAMTEVADALRRLDDDAARGRVIRWATEALGLTTSTKSKGGGNRGAVTDDDSETPEFDSIGKLFEAANPDTNPKRVLLACYWHQEFVGEEELSSQVINNELKQMGYPIPNITATLTSLIQRKPAFVRQVRKSGRTKQARKTYTLTEAGKNATRGLLRGSSGGTAQDDLMP